MGLALAAGGCDARTRTQVVVFLDSDVALEDMDGYRILVFGPDDLGWPPDDTRAVTDRGYPILDEESLPVSFGVAPRDGDAERRVRILVRATSTALVDDANPTGTTGLQTTAVTDFVDHESRRLDMFLAASCTGVTCNEGQTCAPDGCKPEDVDANVLPRWDGDGVR